MGWKLDKIFFLQAQQKVPGGILPELAIWLPPLPDFTMLPHNGVPALAVVPLDDLVKERAAVCVQISAPVTKCNRISVASIHHGNPHTRKAALTRAFFDKFPKN